MILTGQLGTQYSVLGESFVLAAAGDTLSPSATSPIIVSQTATSNLKYLNASSTIVVQQFVVLPIEAESTLTVNQTVVVIGPVYRDALTEISGIRPTFIDPITGELLINEPFGIDHEATVTIIANKLLSSIISFGQEAKVVHLKASAISRLATSTITATDEASSGPFLFAESIIEVTQSATAVIGITAASVIEFITDETIGLQDGQLATVTIVRNLSAVSTIEIEQSFLAILINDLTECEYQPQIGNVGSTEIQRPTLPPIIPITSDRFRLVYPDFRTLGSGTPLEDIILRAPLFGNREGIQSVRVQRETRGGELIIFKDPIWAQFYTLSFQFDSLKHEDAFALLRFIEETIGLEIGIQDHEGNLWAGTLTNPEEAITHDNRTGYSATLEFEAETFVRFNLASQSLILPNQNIVLS